MKQKPEVNPGDRIVVNSRSAVVCTIYPDDKHRKDTIEVVYLDRNRAINEDAYWKDGQWQFVHSGPGGGYADNYERLARYVAILREIA